MGRRPGVRSAPGHAASNRSGGRGAFLFLSVLLALHRRARRRHRRTIGRHRHARERLQVTDLVRRSRRVERIDVGAGVSVGHAAVRVARAVLPAGVGLAAEMSAARPDWAEVTVGRRARLVRAIALGEAIGGHVVAGRVCVGAAKRVRSRRRAGNADVRRRPIELALPVSGIDRHVRGGTPTARARARRRG